MKPISLHVSEEDYQSFKTLAGLRGRPVAELLREAMAEYLLREGSAGLPLSSLPAHDSGRLLREWSREELFDEMLGE